jgi:hypothetical protein
MNASILSHAAGDVNPHAVQAGESLSALGAKRETFDELRSLFPATGAAVRSAARCMELAAGKLMAYHFARKTSAKSSLEVVPQFGVYDALDQKKYTIGLVSTLDGFAPQECQCNSFKTSPRGAKFCSHTDALYWLLGQAGAGQIILSSAPAPLTPCSNIRCFSPCIMVRIYVVGRAEFTHQICSKSVGGSCTWKKVA